MKKLIVGMTLGIVMFLSTSMSAWAGSLDVEIAAYFNARYFYHADRGYIDFEQVTSILGDWDNSAAKPIIVFTYKNGSSERVDGASNGDSYATFIAFKTGFGIYKNARIALLTKASSDIGSIETLKIIFQ